MKHASLLAESSQRKVRGEIIENAIGGLPEPPPPPRTRTACRAYRTTNTYILSGMLVGAKCAMLTFTSFDKRSIRTSSFFILTCMCFNMIFDRIHLSQTPPLGWVASVWETSGWATSGYVAWGLSDWPMLQLFKLLGSCEWKSLLDILLLNLLAILNQRACTCSVA